MFTGYFRNDKKDGRGTFHSEHGETFEVSNKSNYAHKACDVFHVSAHVERSHHDSILKALSLCA